MIANVENWNVKHTLFIVSLLAIITYFSLTLSFSHTYDSEYWAIIMQNIETGNGLYEINGYYYTPVWGYFLSFIDMVYNALGCIPIFGDKFTSLIGIEDYYGYQAILTTPQMNFLIKAPLSIFAVITGYFLFRLVLDYTKNIKRAYCAMILWCFCPITVYMTAIQGQFDSIFVFTIILSIFLIRRENYLLAGIMFALSVWLKLFSCFTLFLFLGYIYARHKDDGKLTKNLLMSIVGATICTLVIFAPVIIEGDMEYAFTFLLSRSEISDMDTLYEMYFVLIISVLLSAWGCIRLSKMNPHDADIYYPLFSCVVIASTAAIYYGYQYAAIIIAFVVLFMLLDPGPRIKKRYYALYAMIGTFAAIEAIVWVNYSSLFTISAYWGVFDPSIIETLTVNFALNWGSESEYFVMSTANVSALHSVYLFILLCWNDLCKTRYLSLDVLKEYAQKIGGHTS